MPVCFIWVPSHAEVDGNDYYFCQAKKALKLILGNLVVPLSRDEIKTMIKAKVNNLWHKHKGEVSPPDSASGSFKKTGYLESTGGEPQ